MGAWGVGSLENDAALDWLGELVESADPVQQVLDALARVVEAGEPDATTAVVALAAAEVVAAGRGAATTDLPSSASELAAKHHQRLSGDSVVTLARRGVTAAESSELRTLWEESDGDEWLEATRELQDRLLRPPSPPQSPVKQRRRALRVGDVFTIPIDEVLGEPCPAPPADRRVGIGQIVAASDPTNVRLLSFWVVVFDAAYKQADVPEARLATAGKRLVRKLTTDALLYHNHWKLIGNAPVRRRLRPLKPKNIEHSYSPMNLEHDLKDRYGVARST